MLVESKVVIPWEERPFDCNDVVWRYSRNPIIDRDIFPACNSIFNSAVVRFGEVFAGVFRCDHKDRIQRLHTGFSKDGIDWDIDPEPIVFVSDDPDIGKFEYGYDPRVVWIEDRYYVTWCNGYHGPTIGMAYTFDFKKFYQMENAFLPANRNGVLFPEKINGKFAMISRPSDMGHTPFGDIFYSESPDLTHWGCHRHVMGTADGWQKTKVGAGPNLVKIDDGWLFIYHGVLTSCNGFVYSFGGAILDEDKPWIVKHRTKSYLMSPWKDYECVGDVPNVVFPCSALVEDDGRMAIYYGAADTVIGLAFARLDEIIEYIKTN